VRDAEETFGSHNPLFEGTWKCPPEIAFGDYRTQGRPSSLLHSGLCSKSLPHSHHTPLVQIRNDHAVKAELLNIGRNTQPFRVAVLGLNKVTGLTVSHAARLWTEFLIIFLRFGCGGGGGDLNISPNTAISPKYQITLVNFIR